MKFQRINNIAGWTCFGIALLTYWLTLEETASYWDCGEFIAAAYKLEVTHPPGAPLFLLLGRLFSFFAGGDVSRVALWINFMSALSSAFAILFLFWSITLLGRKMVKSDSGNFTLSQSLLLAGAGAVGSLAYAFSDSFWFSAVEAEVYAISSFFTSFVVWGMLKWMMVEDESKANRWIILIAYMIGLSIGVHLLNLVTIPALGLIYYFKKYPSTSRIGVGITLLISLGIIIFINDFIVPGLPSIAGSFELFFVNTIGMPFGSGAFVFCLLIVGGLCYGIWYSQKRNMPDLNISLLSFAFILIGYCSYAAIVIRSNFNPPINENAPRDVMKYVSYLKREQYGSRPLLFGPYFTSKIIDIKPGAPIYIKGKDRYEVADRQYEYVYDKEIFFPRAWSTPQANVYRKIMGLREGEVPTFMQNINYMIQHQIGTMFLRYFMWNVAGRESDFELAGWLGPGSWFEEVPFELRNNKGRNNFFMIPLLIGLLGAFFQFTRDKKNFFVVALLFIMLGIAIVVYLNSVPIQPRERDYIYTGAVYAFTFWIGFAVIAMASVLKKGIKNDMVSTIVATFIAMSAPALMAFEGWDDHDRSDRFFSLDSGQNYLTSCAPNAVLYTGGDNDTFMLWYAQEVEGIRPDVRVLVLSYYNTDWYIEQSMQPINTSAPLKYTLSLKNYRQGGLNDYVMFRDLTLASIDLNQYLELLAKKHPQLTDGTRSIVPSRILTLNVDKAEVLAKGIIPKGMEDLVVDKMEFRLTGNGLEKKDLAILDFLATNRWERPVYVNHTSLSQLKIDLSPFVVNEGNVSRILPIKNPNPRNVLVNTQRAYENLIHKYEYRGLDDESIYYSEDYRKFVINHRSTFNTVARVFLRMGSLDSARKVLLFSLEKMPDRGIPYDETAINTIDFLFQVGEKEKAIAMAKIMGERSNEMGTYLIQKSRGLDNELRKSVYLLGEMQNILTKHGETELANEFKQNYEKFIIALQNKDWLR